MADDRRYHDTPRLATRKVRRRTPASHGRGSTVMERIKPLVRTAILGHNGSYAPEFPARITQEMTMTKFATLETS